MHFTQRLTQKNVLKRVLWTYGIYVTTSLMIWAISMGRLPISYMNARAKSTKKHRIFLVDILAWQEENLGTRETT